MKRRDYNEKAEQGLTLENGSKPLYKEGSHVSRRSFTKGVSRIIGLGALSHFSLLAGKVLAEEPNYAGDDCPGGGDADDYCMPGTDPDECPGEKPPQDYCPPDGTRGGEYDRCDSGVKSADICNEAVDPNTDQCQSGLPADDEDECSKFTHDLGDQCPTGRDPEDACPPKGTDAMGDQCPGGGPVEDSCDPPNSGPSGGDDCSEGTWGLEDDCNATHTDECATWSSPTDDDSCPNGTPQDGYTATVP